MLLFCIQKTLAEAKHHRLLLQFKLGLDVGGSGGVRGRNGRNDVINDSAWRGEGQERKGKR